MRRLLFPALLVPMLLMALAAPALAAPPLKESGTQTQFFSYASSCSGSTCTETILDAFMIDSETLVVCLHEFTYSTRTGQIRSERSGCEETSPDALTITENFDVTLAETTVTFVECNRRGCRETGTATVSAEDFRVSNIYTSSDRGTFSDGECTFRYSSTSEGADVAGTMTINGVVYEQMGSASISEFSVSSRCR